MKMIIPAFAMMFLAGCGQNSMDESNSTNSESGGPPVNSQNTNGLSTNDTIKNNSAAEMTHAPAITNDTSTNLPATTNQ